MSRKIIVSEKQLQVISNYINEDNNRLNNLLSEGVIEEGFKEIALSVLMLAGVMLTGQNKAIAQDALTNEKIIQQVDATLADEEKLNKLISKIEANMPNAGELIQKNADRIKSTINYLDSKNKKKTKLTQTTQTTTTSSPSKLQSKLKTGFAVTGVEIKRDTLLPKGSIVTVRDTIDFKWSSDNFFKTASFELSEEAIDSISKVISDIKIANGKVIMVQIESSTDTEPIKMGNEKLAQLRAGSVQSHLEMLDLGDSKYDIVTKPDSGPDVYSRDMSSGERVEARINTAPHRYVRLKLVVVFEEEVKEGETAPQVVEKHQYELTKIIVNSNKALKLKHKPKSNKTKCQTVAVKGPLKVRVYKCSNIEY